MVVDVSILGKNTSYPIHYEEFEDAKMVIRIRQSEKDRQHNGQKKDNNDIKNTIQKTIDRATRTPPKTGGELRCSGRVINSCPTSGTRRVTLVTNSVMSHERRKDREVLYVVVEFKN